MTQNQLPKVGVLGSGQLGRMLAQVARRQDQEIVVYSPDRNTPTGQIADREVVAPYADLDQVRAFARSVDVITYEFENVPLATAMAAAEFVPVHPDPALLAVAQNRIREKTFLAGLNLPTAPFHIVNQFDDLVEGVAKIGLPAVLKTAESGYDGKGQVKITADDQLKTAWRAINEKPAVLEGWLTFDQEISVIGVRDRFGTFAHFGPIENRHVNHILDLSICPALVAEDIANQAVSAVQTIMTHLNVIGVVCTEFFVTNDPAMPLVANEIAPRPHNSGHLTIEGHVTSQFEQQLRTVSGLPLGSVAPAAPVAAMINLLGDLWPKPDSAESTHPSPNWGCAIEDPTVKLHLYGKGAARPGRKMGHMTTVGQSREEVIEKVVSARERLSSD